MSIWVREFMCGVCGKRHRVEGKRGILGRLQKEKEDKCKKDAEENEASNGRTQATAAAHDDA